MARIDIWIWAELGNRVNGADIRNYRNQYRKRGERGKRIEDLSRFAPASIRARSRSVGLSWRSGALIEEERSHGALREANAAALSPKAHINPALLIGDVWTFLVITEAIRCRLALSGFPGQRGHRRRPEPTNQGAGRYVDITTNAGSGLASISFSRGMMGAGRRSKIA